MKSWDFTVYFPFSALRLQTARATPTTELIINGMRLLVTGKTKSSSRSWRFIFPITTLTLGTSPSISRLVTFSNVCHQTQEDAIAWIIKLDEFRECAHPRLKRAFSNAFYLFKKTATETQLFYSAQRCRRAGLGCRCRSCGLWFNCLAIHSQKLGRASECRHAFRIQVSRATIWRLRGKNKYIYSIYQ